MPELPDIMVYVESLEARIKGERLEKIRLGNPFILRTFDPPLSATSGRIVERVERIGKRIILALSSDLCVVVHLMIAGRFQWKKPNAKLPGRVGHAAFDFAGGTLVLTEAGTKKRASIHLVAGRAALAAFDRGGLEVMDSNLKSFHATLIRENRTLKRALTDPRLFSGIGNAYSDEILHRARLSPLTLSQKLSDEEVARLHTATTDTLKEWIDRLRDEARATFPEKVTAFRREMAVHGKFGKPCPVCATKVQRIVYAQNEANYCPRCQTGGKILSDRSLARLLKDDWPKTIDELEQSELGKGWSLRSES
jgi:formamidopyrimidine-DNA glycosylase